MKKIFSILLTTIVALSFAPVVSAQYSIDDFIKEKYGSDATIVFHHDEVKLPADKHFGYSKGISSPFSDGNYWIKLESFATGSAEQEVKPADVVLVLDFSGSMNSNYKTGNHYDVVLGSNGGFAYSNTFWTATAATGQRFYKTDGHYYQVKRDREATGGTYVDGGGTEREEFWQYLYFDKDGIRYFLDGMNVVTTMPKKYTNANNNAIIWSGALYEYKNFNTTGSSGGNTWTRLRELRSAVAEFIDILYRNDNEYGSTPLGNRLSIVTYQTSSASQLISGWVPVTNADGSRDETLLKALAGKSASGATPTDKGMTEAVNVLSGIPSTRDSKRTVVLLTDGLPGNVSSWTDANCMPTATGCISQAYLAKQNYGATVFSVSIYPGTYTEGMTTFLECTSSNYPNANPANSNSFEPKGDRLPDDKAIYTKINPTSLTDLFAEIASMSGGSGANLTSASSTVDIISHSFKFPDNFDASQVKIFTAGLLTINNLGEANEEYVFGEEILSGFSPDKYKVYHPTTGAYMGEYFVDEHQGDGIHGEGLKAEIVTMNGEPGIKVTNFDYKNNWCGPVKDKDGNISYYTGHKIIILIPIQMNPDAIGGPNVETNGDHSGVYLNNGQSYVEFKSPTVSLPVNIYIEKAGLVGVESAKFLIERAVLPDLPAGQDDYTQADILALTDWEYVTSVYVTNSDNYPHDPDSGNPLVKVKGLSATKTVNGVQKGLVYRVSEEGWSWTYNKTGAEYQYTITGQSNNPFTFTNTSKTETVKHAESKVTNIFKSVQTKEVYDDSKTNTRQ